MKARLLRLVSLSLAYTCAVTISPAQPKPYTAPAIASNGPSEPSEVRGSELTEPQYTIAFKSFAPNNSDIFIAEEDGGHVRPLVPDPALDYLLRMVDWGTS